jgi:hypothetical protein
MSWIFTPVSCNDNKLSECIFEMLESRCQIESDPVGELGNFNFFEWKIEDRLGDGRLQIWKAMNEVSEASTEGCRCGSSSESFVIFSI